MLRETAYSIHAVVEAGDNLINLDNDELHIERLIYELNR